MAVLKATSSYLKVSLAMGFLLGACSIQACTGGGTITSESSPNSNSGNPGKSDGFNPTNESVIIPMGLRRLSRSEYDQTLLDLLLDDQSQGQQMLPEDVGAPFDNDFQTQQASSILIESLETLALDAAGRLVADQARRDQIVGCTPEGTTDENCLTQFIETFGKHAFRRPLIQDEIDRFLTLQTIAAERNDFYASVELIVASVLQDPNFVYRVEIGTPVEGLTNVFRLNDYEIATRLAYFLLGTTPDAGLLAIADADGLSTSAQVRAVAQDMLQTPEARKQVEKFHSMWLGYDQLPHEASITLDMQKESAALIEKVIFDQKKSWLDLFSSSETFLTDNLADHYELPRPATASGSWVDYGTSGRQGLLSHGSFLSVASKFSDTSPTQRGILIRERLMCDPIPPPPPSVDADDAPVGEAGDCKIDRYAKHREGGCEGCHKLTDEIGFGLENYDRAGKYRAHDDGAPECIIEGEGSLEEVGTFQGPVGLSDVLIESNKLAPCAVEHLFRYALGQEKSAIVYPYLEELSQNFEDQSYRFDDLMLSLVSSESFFFRSAEAEELP